MINIFYNIYLNMNETSETNKKYKISKKILHKINNTNNIIENLFKINNINVLENNINTRTININNESVILYPDIYNKTIENISIKKNLNGNKIILGQGHFGKVYNINSTNLPIVYKTIVQNINNEYSREDAVREYKSLKFQYLLQLYLKFNEPFKLKYLCKLYEYGFINEQNNFLNIYAIMENCGKELGKYVIELKFNQTLNVKLIINIIIECAKGIKVLHDIGYIHLDIKPDNFLIKDDKIKIIDFGYTSKKNKLIYCGKPTYMAPEILKSNENYPANVKLDIFSLGCIFVMFLIILFENLDEDIFDKIMVCPINKFKNNDTTLKIMEIRRNYNIELFKDDIKNIKISLEENLPLNKHKKEYIENIIIILNKMINPDIDERYSDINELIYDLEEIHNFKNNVLKHRFSFTDLFRHK